MSDLRDDVRGLFAEFTGRSPDGIWSAPGQVALLGGDVGSRAALSVAIDRRTLVAAGSREDAVLRLASTEADTVVEIDLADVAAARGRAGWAGVPLGVVWALERSGADLAAVPGVDLVVESNVPIGVGLAASTALAGAVALALADLWRWGRTPDELADLVRRAEADYVGAASGWGGPETTLRGRPGSAVLTTGSGVDVIDLGFHAAGLALLVIATDGAPAGAPLAADTAAIDEEAWVRDAAEQVRASRTSALGALLDVAHVAARHRDGSSPELDLAVETARENGALGARATRGGAVIALTPVDAVSRIQVAIDGAFAEHGLGTPEVIPVHPSAGATRDL